MKSDNAPSGFFLAQKIRGATDVLEAEPTAQTVATLAVVVVKLEKCLRVGSSVAGNASHRPVADDGIVLGRQLLPQGKSAVAEAVVGLVATVGKEHGSHAVDDKELDGCRRKRLLHRLGGLRGKGVVGAPVVAHMGEEQGTHLFEALSVEQPREVEPLLVVEHGKLRNADVGEVLRTKPKELPGTGRDGREGEFMTEITVLLLQSEVVVILHPCALWRRVFEQTCLTEEDGFNLKQVVAMLAHRHHGDGTCPPLESVAIDAKAETAGKGDKEGVFPVLIKALTPLHDLTGALLETLEGEGGHPVVYLKEGQSPYHLSTTGTGIVVAEGSIVLTHRSGYGELQLRNGLSVRIIERLVDVSRHMQDDIIIGRVGVVVVSKPVAAPEVQLHVAHPFRAVQFNLCPREVRTCIGVVNAGAEHLEQTPVGGTKLAQGEKLVHPCVMQELFHVLH